MLTMNTDENTRDKSKPTLEKLPGDVVGVICKYLDIKERNSLLSISKTLRIEQKKYCYLNLNKESSLKFYEDEMFRDIINNLVKYPRRQISLDLFEASIVDVSALGNVHTLDLAYCKSLVDASALKKVRIYWM